MVKTPEKKEVLTILKDTTQSKNFELRKIERNVVHKKGGNTEWKQVICENDITKPIVDQIQNALRDLGYYNEDNNNKLDSKTKSALTDFQRENRLPIGQLDYETLDVLGVRY